VTETVDASVSVLLGIARGAGSGRDGAGEALGVAFLAGAGLIGVVHLIVSVDASADSATEVSELGGIAGSAAGTIGASQAGSRAC
jgi:hypothetical protein